MESDSASRGTDTVRPEEVQPPETATPPGLEPVRSGERVELLDIFRGVAIFGILLVNMQVFFAPIYLFGNTSEWFPGVWNDTAIKLITFFAQGKFYTMFSFLFGVGAALQLERAEARGLSFPRFFSKRMFWLLVIGLVHALLIWFGDILFYYAAFGFLLILFRKAKPKTLVIWTVVLMLVPLLLMGAFTGLMGVFEAVDPDAYMKKMAEQGELRVEKLAEAIPVYREGPWSAIFAYNFGQWGQIALFTLLFGFGLNIVGLFLIGLNVGRRRVFHDIGRHLPTMRRWIVPLGLVGLAGNAVLVALMDKVDPNVLDLMFFTQQVCGVIGGVALCFTYVFGITLLAQTSLGARLLSPLRAVGRMALSNYLMHSIVFTTLAAFYGAGLYGSIGPALGLALTVGMYVVQIPLSNWWLGRFRFGPMEWVWRSLTYGKAQPMRR